jgi:hypothetical protein
VLMYGLGRKRFGFGGCASVACKMRGVSSSLALESYRSGQVNVTLCLAKTRNVAIVWLAAASA